MSDEYRITARYGLTIPDPRFLPIYSCGPVTPKKKRIDVKKYLLIALPFILIANLVALGDYGCMQSGKRLGVSHMMMMPITMNGTTSIIPVPIYQCK